MPFKLVSYPLHMKILTTVWVGCIITFSLVTSDCEILTVKSNAVTYAGSGGLLLSENDSKDQRQRRALVVADGDSKTMTETHNVLRRKEESSDMETLTWNVELAKMAQEWAKRCDFVHGQPYRDPSVLPYSWIGQNLFATTGTLNATTAIVNAWYDEKKFFDYNTLKCETGKVCGHYTQVVWASTTVVGCGYSLCSRLGQTNFQKATYFVCNYGPGGNYEGQKPYKKGKACSDCDSGKTWCNKGLCNQKCKTSSPECECSGTCQNCGTMKYSSCTCSCLTGWHGTSCSEVCKNTHQWCNANPGWPPSWCNHITEGPNVRKNCPAMCGLCKASNGSEPLTCSSERNERTPYGSLVTLLVSAMSSFYIRTFQ